MITSSFFEHGTKVLTGICSDLFVQHKYYGRKMRKVMPVYTVINVIENSIYDIAIDIQELGRNFVN